MTVAEMRFLESVPNRLKEIVEQLERLNSNIEKYMATRPNLSVLYEGPKDGDEDGYGEYEHDDFEEEE